MPGRLQTALLTPLLHLTLELSHQFLGPVASGLHGLTVTHPMFTAVTCGVKKKRFEPRVIDQCANVFLLSESSEFRLDPNPNPEFPGNKRQMPTGCTHLHLNSICDSHSTRVSKVFLTMNLLDEL